VTTRQILTRASYRRVAGSAWGELRGEPGAVPGFLRALTRSGGPGDRIIRGPVIPGQRIILPVKSASARKSQGV
jgi:hypothetical protein